MSLLVTGASFHASSHVRPLEGRRSAATAPAEMPDGFGSAGSNRPAATSAQSVPLLSGPAALLTPAVMADLMAYQEHRPGDGGGVDIQAAAARPDAGANYRTSKSDMQDILEPGTSPSRAAGPLAELDTDGDGAVSAQELLAATRQRIDHRRDEDRGSNADPSNVTDTLRSAKHPARAQTSTGVDGLGSTIIV
jgi:hypothetical protein